MRITLRHVLFALPLAIFAGLAAMFAVGLSAPPPDELISPLIDKPVPAFSLPPLDSQSPAFTRTDLSSGEPTIVNFWASWCTPCREEQPVLRDLARREGIRLYGVVYKDTPEKARAFLDQLGDPFGKLVLDQPGRVSIDWGVTGAPETFVIDGQGIIRAHYSGALTPDVLETKIFPAMR